MAATQTIKQLLEAGVHFGHQKKRWNPKMKKFIFGEKNGIYIIDLEKTEKALARALGFLRETASKGEAVLFVGTKKQAKDVIKEEALRCGMFYVTERWLGGMLTNYATIKKSIKRHKEITKMQEDGTFEKLSKKETAKLGRELAKLNRDLEGVLDMGKLPAALFIVDSKKEEIAVSEANNLGIAVVGLIDTNCDPEKISHPIPGNDDAIRSIKLITSLVSNAVSEGRKAYLDDKAAEEARQAAEDADDKVEVDEDAAEELKKKVLKGKKVEEAEPAVKKKKTTKA
ncbi:MAG TPA: 30S ribosomal protein S2 [Candidatus Omnitrophota bacterium]|nr:30S ribosomal protein S2 [Candidatus Omnitrophota bacterium]HOX10017.1 30S ribosomal protein S2 [Candidatus Omnitrophota bacterium]HRZ66872.1 30S ribosomal protein S2 [Candidatus Omnitrophota bacterium]